MGASWFAVLLVATAALLTPADAQPKRINFPWGITPTAVYYIKRNNPAFGRPTPESPPPLAMMSQPPIVFAGSPPPSPAAKSPPPSPALSSPPPSPATPPPPSPSTATPPPPLLLPGRRLNVVHRYLHPYRDLTVYSKKDKTYKFKTVTLPKGSSISFILGGYAASAGFHGLAYNKITKSKDLAAKRCGTNPTKLYYRQQTKKVVTVTFPNKGTYNFFDPTLRIYKKYRFTKTGKRVFDGYAQEQYNCLELFESVIVEIV